MTRIVLIVALSIAAATSASADPFYDAYQRGLAAFKDKDYPTARGEFQRAYDLRPEPIVLFNIAQSYRLENNTEQALVYYRRFLADSKASQDLRDEAQRHVGELEAQARAEVARREREAEHGPKEPDGSAVTVPPPPPRDHMSPADPPSPERPRTRRVPTTSWVAVGVAGAGVAGGIVFGILGKRAESDLESNPNATQADADRVESYETAINTSWGIAAAAAATGVVLYFAMPSYTSDRRIAIAPVAGGGWAASLGGRF